MEMKRKIHLFVCLVCLNGRICSAFSLHNFPPWNFQVCLWVCVCVFVWVAAKNLRLKIRHAIGKLSGWSFSACLRKSSRTTNKNNVKSRCWEGGEWWSNAPKETTTIAAKTAVSEELALILSSANIDSKGVCVRARVSVAVRQANKARDAANLGESATRRRIYLLFAVTSTALNRWI